MHKALLDQILSRLPEDAQDSFRTIFVESVAALPAPPARTEADRIKAEREERLKDAYELRLQKELEKAEAEKARLAREAEKRANGPQPVSLAVRPNTPFSVDQATVEREERLRQIEVARIAKLEAKKQSTR